VRPGLRIARPSAAGLTALALLASAALYLWTAQRTFRLGLPLDDAWIHQTYARNLVELKQWAFLPGEPSAGSTAPLWTGVLAVGYWLRVNPLLFAYAVGMAVLGLVAWLAVRWVQALVPERAGWAWTLAVLFGLEWHLVWAGLSGMETLAVAGLAACTASASVGRGPAAGTGCATAR